MFNLKIVGLQETIDNLNSSIKIIGKAKETSQASASLFGLELVKTKVPVYSGNIVDGIIKIDEPDRSEIISMPSLDPEDVNQKMLVVSRGGRTFTMVDPGKPDLNVLLERGDLSGLNWSVFGISQPSNGEFHFMESSVPQTREEFIRLLNVGIQEATK